MTKILYLDHAPIYGGAEVVLLNLLSGLDRTQWTPLVATTNNATFLTALQAQSVETIITPFGRLHQAGMTMPINLMQAAWAVRRIIRQQNIHLIHSNTVRAHLVGSIAALMAHTPIFWTLHDNTFPRWLVRALAPIPRRVIAVSHWLGAFYGSLGLAHKLQVIHNGLPLSPPIVLRGGLREELGVPTDAPFVVNVGRLVDGKAPHLYVQAAQLALREIPTAYFALVGGADSIEPGQRPSNYPDQLARVIEDCHLGAHLLVTGQRHDVARFYAAADVVVYNSIAPEGLPTVLLEAMHYAVPIVASAIGGAVEIVQHEDTGLLAPAGDPAALSAALVRLLRDRNYAHALGQRGRDRLVSDFDLLDQVERTEQVYRQTW